VNAIGTNRLTSCRCHTSPAY